MPLTSGTVIESCRIEDTLGVGGFGVTYRAYDLNLNRIVALKENFPSWLVRRADSGRVVLSGDLAAYNWSMRHFLQEARILKELSHPNIVRVYRDFECNGTAYFEMEYLDAVSLSALKSYRNWNRESLTALITQVLQALSYIHSRNIFHRDIKPANIMLRRSDKSAVLIDFGAAKNAPSSEIFTQGFVSMGFTPPEQMADSQLLSPSIDIYAFGATLYCILLGETPPNPTARSIKDEIRHLADLPVLQSRFPRALLASIDKALALDPGMRHASAMAWLNALSASSDPLPAQSEPRPKPQPERKPKSEIQTRRRIEANGSNDIIPLSIIFFRGCLWSGLLLLLLIVISLGGSPQHNPLDALFPLALVLTAIGFGHLLWQRFLGPKN